MNLEDDILIERFLRNELSEEEKQTFLDRLDTDAEFREHFAMEKQLSESLDDNSWSFVEERDLEEVVEYESLFKTEETKNIKQAILKAQGDYQNSQKPSKNWFLYVAAAVVVVLFSVLMFNNSPKSNNDLFASYFNESDLLSLVDRAGYDSIFNIAQTSFENEEYNNVVKSLSPIVDTVQNANAYLYLAISQIELDSYSDAEKTLDKLIESNLLDNQKGYWYKSLLFLKSNQIEKSKKELERIIQNSYYNSQRAEELLKELR